MNKLAVGLIAGVLAVGLLVAGCGGGDSSTSSAASSTGAAASGTSTSTTSARAAGSNASKGASDNEATDNGSKPAPTTKAAFLEQANAICIEGKKKTDEELKKTKGDLISSTIAGLQLDVDGIGSLGAQSEVRQVEAMLSAVRGVIANAETNISKANKLLETAEKNAGKYGLTKCFAH